MSEKMNYHIIKAYMMAQQVKFSQLEKEFNTSRQMIWGVIKNNIKSGQCCYLIRRRIAELCKIDYKEMWGTDDPYWHGKLITRKKRKYKKKRKKHAKNTV